MYWDAGIVERGVMFIIFLMLKGEEVIVKLIQALGGVLEAHFVFTSLNFTEVEWLLKLLAKELVRPECKGSKLV